MPRTKAKQLKNGYTGDMLTSSLSWDDSADDVEPTYYWLLGGYLLLGRSSDFQRACVYHSVSRMVGWLSCS